MRCTTAIEIEIELEFEGRRAWIFPRQEMTMAKVGRFVTDPKAGAYCQITLDSGDKILVNHDQGGFKRGRVMIDLSKWMGFSADRLFSIDLDSAPGAAVLVELTRDAPAGSVGATPLGAIVQYIKDCRSVDEVKAKCARLTPRG